MKHDPPEDIEDLIRQLQALRTQEDAIIDRIQRSAADVEVLGTPADGFADRHGNLLHVGDRVRFKGTRATRGGEGKIIGFTNGPDPFVRISRDGAAFIITGNKEVRRQPANLEKIE
jgi:hypothetical protein